MSKYTTKYCEELKLINGFLYNLTSNELGEVVYHSYATALNFSDQQKNHYYLVWKISGYSYRMDIKDKVKADFKRKFGSGITSYKYQ